MKMRTGFVTNSSSSSFIIGKTNSDWTVEKVYQVIVKALKKAQNERREFVNLCEKKGIDLYVNNHKGGFYCSYRLNKDSYSYEENEKTLNKIKMLHGESFMKKLDNFCWDTYPTDDCSLIHDSYEDFLKYWSLRFYGTENPSGSYEESNLKNSGDYPPFAIFDLSSVEPTIGFTWSGAEFIYSDDEDDDEVNKSRYIYKANCIDPELYSIDSQEINWYYGDFKTAINNLETCETCDHKEWCSEYKCIIHNKEYKYYEDYTCHDLKKLYKENNYAIENSACILLGKILVRSYCGQIIDQVQEALIEISERYCDHMG